jgi:hypothetical protein
MRVWRRLVVILVIAATAALLYRWWQTASSKSQRRGSPTRANDDPEVTATGAAGASFPARESASDAGTQHGGPKLDRAQADRMREEIRALLAEAGVLGLAGEPIEAGAAVPAPTFGSMPVLGLDDAGNPRVDPKYIQARVREDLFPLALDCYSDALKRSPKLAGKLVVYFRVIGDHKVGGVVDEAKLVDGTTIDDREMQTCVRESMMSVSFDAPPHDGELTVVYPIEFAPDDPDGN